MTRNRHIAFALLLAGAVWWTWAADDLSLSYGDTDFKTAREADDKERPFPTWPVDVDFKADAFQFTRLNYTAQPELYGRGHTDADKRWLIDFPAGDLGLSYRLHQMTSIKVDPDGRVVKLTDTNLLNHPFLYLIEAGRGFLTELEVPILRKYLLNGGFLMVDDFWGEREWRNFTNEIQRLFPAAQYPNQKISDLPLEHPVFHTVFDLKEKPQVPGIPHFVRWGRSHERDEEGEEVHYRGIHDDKGRLIVLICHNTDLGDGWEREGDNEEYFRKFSEPKAFPMGINAIVYAMTH